MTRSRLQKWFDGLLLLLFWLYVSVPLGWGVWSTIEKAMALFNL